MGRIQDGVSIGQVIRQKLLEQPETQMVFLPEVGPRISWDPNRLEVEYQEGELAYDWKIARNILEYIPGKFQINIVQYPRVDIRYVGKSGEFPEGPAGDGKNETAGSRSAAC